jgi:hypothetical protein
MSPIQMLYLDTTFGTFAAVLARLTIRDQLFDHYCYYRSLLFLHV